MAKLVFLSALIVIGSASTCYASVSISASYAATANILQILDCISDRNKPNTEGDCQDDSGYIKDWNKRFGPLTNEDKKLLAEYARLRQKYFNDPDAAEENPLKNRNGFFARIGSEHADQFAPPFYSSNDLNTVYKKLSSVVTKAELGRLKTILAHFDVQLQAYLKESRVYIEAAKQMNASLRKPEFSAFYDEIMAFYNVKEDVHFEVIYVWWPLLNRDITPRYGQFFVMERNPASPDLAKPDTDITTHEIVHSISSQQDLKQKQTLTAQFLRGCDPLKKVRPLRVLEEPLAVSIGQMLFLERFKPDEFKATRRWYRNSWVNEFAPHVFPEVKEAFRNKKSITDGIIGKLIPSCKKLNDSKSEFP
jgi:hypothetical protein